MHGPCGALTVCMKDGKCGKGYPKVFVENTTTGDKPR